LADGAITVSASIVLVQFVDELARLLDRQVLGPCNVVSLAKQFIEVELEAFGDGTDGPDLRLRGRTRRCLGRSRKNTPSNRSALENSGGSLLMSFEVPTKNTSLSWSE
jgi:hypothetical protein